MNSNNKTFISEISIIIILICQKAGLVRPIQQEVKLLSHQHFSYWYFLHHQKNQYGRLAIYWPIHFNKDNSSHNGPIEHYFKKISDINLLLVLALHTCHNEESCPPCTVLTTKQCMGSHEVGTNYLFLHFECIFSICLIHSIFNSYLI